MWTTGSGTGSISETVDRPRDRRVHRPVDTKVEFLANSRHRRRGPLVRRARMSIAIRLRHHSRFPFGPLSRIRDRWGSRTDIGYYPWLLCCPGCVRVESSDAERHLVTPLGLGLDAGPGHDAIQCRGKQKNKSVVNIPHQQYHRRTEKKNEW